ncbi:MAG: hypothetical protein PUC88_02260 [Clostridia bacterium]|nr:hypothetical protein [Clostridia bacterium]
MEEQIKKKYGRRCPYCGEKVSFIYAATHLKDGEYTCKKCGKYSNIKYNPLIYFFILLTAVLGAFLGLQLFKEEIKGIILCIVPFVLMYMSLPLFFRLMPIKLKSRNSETSEKDYKKQQRESQRKIKKEKPATENVKKYVPKKKADIISDDIEEGSTKYIPNIK